MSVGFHFRYNIEWSFNNEAPFWTHFTLLWFRFLFINIHDVPLLIETIVLVPDNDLSVLVIMTTMNIEDLALLVDDISIVVSEHLPPSGVCTLESKVVTSTTALNADTVTLVGYWLDCSILIKHKLLLSLVHNPLSDSQVSCTLVFNDSVGWHS